VKFSFFDFLSILLIVATIAVVVFVLVLFIDPYSSINPFPFPTTPPTISVPSLTPTLFTFPPTWTPTPNTVATPIP